MFRFTRDDHSIEERAAGGWRLEQVDKMLEAYDKAAADPA